MFPPAASRHNVGLRMFVDGLLEVRDLAERIRKREKLDATLGDECEPMMSGPMLDSASGPRSRDVTQGASARAHAETRSAASKHIEFVSLGAGPGAGGDWSLPMAMSKTGFFRPPPGLNAQCSMREAANFTECFCRGTNADRSAQRDARGNRCAAAGRILTAPAAALIESGLAVWEDEGGESERLIVRGRANLLSSDGCRGRAGPDQASL
jgi:heat-inducible transcriptional repressor